MFGLSVLTALAMGVDTRALGGLYKFDPSTCPKESRDPAQAIFGGPPLFLGDNGEFYHERGMREGFWRVVGSKAVLVNSGFWDVTYVAPEALIRRTWPKSEVEGVVFDIQKDGSLVLPKFGALKGPITLRPIPRMSTAELLRRSLDEDRATWWSEWNRVAEGRFDEAFAIAKSSKTEPRLRAWAAGSLKGITPEHADMILNFALSLSNKQKERGIRQLLRSLASSLLKAPSDETLRRIFTHRALFPSRDHSVLEAIRANRMINHSDIVDYYLSSEEPETVMYACRAASVTDHKLSLVRIRPLCDHSDRGVKVAALGAVARLTDDDGERASALWRLHKLMDSDAWGGSDVVRAWEESGRREAVPYLVHVMLGPFLDQVRRDAATALGNLGFPEAVPALIRCKLGVDENGLSPLESRAERSAEESLRAWISGTSAQQAAAESLWKFDQKAKLRVRPG